MKVWCVLLLLLVGFVSGETYYVSNSGNDSWDGKSDATAWKTIGKVNSFNFSVGDDVYFKCGDEWKNERLVIDWLGTSEYIVIIGAYYEDRKTCLNKVRPIINGQWNPDTFNFSVPNNEKSTNLLSIDQKSNHIFVENLQLKNSVGRGLYSGLNYDIHISNLYVENNYNGGIGFIGVENGSIQNCEITEVGKSRWNPNDDYPHSLGANRFSKNILIKNNTVHGNFGEGIGSYWWTENITVEDNIVYDNKVNIYFDRVKDSVIRNNLVYSTGASRYRVGNGTGIGIAINNERQRGEAGFTENIDIYSNLVAGCGRGVSFNSAALVDGNLKKLNIYGNTLVDNNYNFYSYMIENLWDYEDVNVINNIAWCLSNVCEQFEQGASNVQGVNWDYNLWWDENSHNSGVDGERVSGNDIVTNPSLNKSNSWRSSVPVLIVEDDFKLQLNSSAINNGTNLGFRYSLDYFGNERAGNWDIGAIEFIDGEVKITNDDIRLQDVFAEIEKWKVGLVSLSDVFVVIRDWVSGGWL